MSIYQLANSILLPAFIFQATVIISSNKQTEELFALIQPAVTLKTSSNKCFVIYPWPPHGKQLLPAGHEEPRLLMERLGLINLLDVALCGLTLRATL